MYISFGRKRLKTDDEEEEKTVILFINACVRKQSRTKRLSERLLKSKTEPITELRLWELDFPVVDEAFLNKRDNLIASGSFDDSSFSLARQFAVADEIVIAAPFWDLSFPASLKQYIEQINVLGITFCYTEEGLPKGLCKAKKLTFVTTAGGDFFPVEYGFGYIKALAENFYGIKQVELLFATGLDVLGRDPNAILDSVKIK